jgi:exopolyphosphatase/guanosine-5'-triphosphate,3'-diphosphate pyrophosphatase
MALADRALRRTSIPSARYAGRIGVIDIGSNSIRLVVFDGLSRVPVLLFNERVICGLGRGVGPTGKLNPQGVELALVNLLRFTRLAEAMSVATLDLLATAAVRDAENGRAFVAEVERRCGHPVQVLGGDQEARLSALGVVAGLPEADGVMGDLGGGSLELVELQQGAIGHSATLPLGPLRLIDLSGDDRSQAAVEVARHLSQVAWLKELRGRSFYAVGGAWRALARVQMEQSDYPLYVIHGFTLARSKAAELATVIGQQGKRSLARLGSVSRRRAEALPYAAILLGGILDVGQPREVVFSSFGLREGFLYDRLPEDERRQDPLLIAARDFAQREGRFPDLGEDLVHWVAPLFEGEKRLSARLVAVTCHLADIAWREHPDYRAVQAYTRLLYYPFVGLDHIDRAFLAFAVFMRYGGSPEEAAAATARALLSEKLLQQARVLGLALRLAFSLSGGTGTMLARTRLALANRELLLSLPADGSLPPGEAIERRLKALAEAAGAREHRLELSKKL